MVSLPFKDVALGFTNMFKVAVNRFFLLEKRLQRNVDLKHEYAKCLEEYIEMEHMSEINPANFPNGYFIPHHCVIKETSSTTRLRVVFDASAKDSNLNSLNDHLCNGPKLQMDLLDLLLQFRRFRFAFTADIGKMYRQILIDPSDRKFQLIVWRSDPNSPLKFYSLNTVTFGTTSAPYLAIKTLFRLAEDEAANYPLGAKCLQNGFYVDDFIYGTDTIPEAIEIQNQTVGILKSAGFVLRKWSANDESLLTNIPECDRETKTLLSFDSKSTIKTLGIQWSPLEDNFQYSLTLCDHSQHSKRTILSDTAKIFDPVGWISPIIIKAKLIMQQLWLRKIDWDEVLPGDIVYDWENLRTDLKNIGSIKIPRWLKTSSEYLIDLHGFADASMRAYAAVVYVKALNSSDTPVNLLISKSKVAPCKTLSLPRLELCAAALLARLMDHVLNIFKDSVNCCFYWSDSTITLAWIKDTPMKRKIFVANKITEIQNLSDPSSWRHVESKLNPADLASRGVSATDLINNSLWWQGPPFILNDIEKDTFQTDESVVLPVEENVKPKSKKTLTVQTLLTRHRPSLAEITSNVVLFQDPSLNKFSTLPKLIRVIAYCRRFLCKNRYSSLVISNEEFQGAYTVLLGIVQREAYPEEVEDLKTNGKVEKLSSIFSLDPIFIESDQLIRANTRLCNADHLTIDQRFPVILPYNHIISTLIVRHAHLSTLHGTTQQVVMLISQRFHIVKLRRLIHTVLHHCVKCFRFKCKVLNQKMAGLPRLRTTPAKPFLNCGVDFAGPIELKRHKGRCNVFEKGYFAIFICFATKAIHLEVVEDLSSNAFVAAFHRLIGRRGRVQNLHSDCGTNFIGSEKTISKSFRDFKKHWNAEIQSELAKEQTNWHFNPPASPHFGGLWEAGVKSAKHHLKRIVGSNRLTFQEFSTVLVQIEACLNSRPLCQMNGDPNTMALTPGHFLVGESMVCLPGPNLIDVKMSSLDRWNFMQRLVQGFWQLWSMDYLNTLRHRSKWRNTRNNVKINDVILVIENNLPPTSWLLGRVIETHAGNDGLIRVVTIKTATSILKRPIVKICPLPIN